MEKEKLTIGFESDITLIFKNKEGNKIESNITLKDLLERTLEDFYEDLEHECICSSCNNESQNFCDCGALYEDYEIHAINIPEHLYININTL